mgnify:FL=1
MRLSKVVALRIGMHSRGMRPAGGTQPTGELSVPHGFRNRSQEKGLTYFRCDRFFTVAHQWYVTLRGGAVIGPYPDRTEAKVALAKQLAGDLYSTAQGAAALDDNENRQTGELEELIRLSLECATQRRLGGDNSAYAWLMQRLDSLRQTPADPDRVNLQLRLLTSLCEDLDSGHGRSANEKNRAPLWFQG